MRQVIGEKNLFDILRTAPSAPSHEDRAISFQLSVVSCQLFVEIGGRKSETGNRKQETGNRETRKW